MDKVRDEDATMHPNAAISVHRFIMYGGINVCTDTIAYCIGRKD